MLTYPKSTTRVRRMPMHLSSGHVTLMPGKLYPPLISSQSDLWRRADSRWALLQISRLFMFCYKFFVQREISEVRGSTNVKFCTMVNTRLSFIMPVQNFGEGTPQKKFRGQKHAKFSPNSDDFKVRLRISPERLKIFKIGELLVRHRFFRARRSKSSEFRSSDFGDLDVKLYPPKTHFLEDHISAPRGCCAPKFLHALENDQFLLAHLPSGTKPSLQHFSKWSQKLS